jgi:hypothetical protein
MASAARIMDGGGVHGLRSRRRAGPGQELADEADALDGGLSRATPLSAVAAASPDAVAENDDHRHHLQRPSAQSRRRLAVGYLRSSTALAASTASG